MTVEPGFGGCDQLALFVSGSVKGKQVCVVSWECGGGGGVSVGLEPSDDKPHRGVMSVVVANSHVIRPVII